jgi:hypothetical protein
LHAIRQGKAIPVIGREGPWGCQTSRLPYFLDNRLTDGGKVASLTQRPLFTPPGRIAFNRDVKGKGKAVPVTGREGPWGCVKSRLPYFLDNRLADGGEVVSLTRRPPFTPQEDCWYSFLLEAESTPGL